MLQNPFLPAPTAANAWAEGFIKGYAALASPEPGEDVGLDDIEAFNQGVTAGDECARAGLSLGDPCIEAAEEHGPLHGTAMAIDVTHIVHGVWHAQHLATLAGGVASIVVGLIGLACTLPVHARPPEELLPGLGQPMVDALAAGGIGSMELFCGAGLDPTTAGCEILLTPLFTSFESARQAAVDLDRMQWVVASWRTDQSNSFTIVEDGVR